MVCGVGAGGRGAGRGGEGTFERGGGAWRVTSYGYWLIDIHIVLHLAVVRQWMTESLGVIKAPTASGAAESFIMGISHTSALTVTGPHPCMESI
jgi:hypothetical protein